MNSFWLGRHMVRHILHLQFASRLHQNLQFYFQSRKVETLDQALSLLVVDRMKKLLPKNLLEHVLAQEGEEWLTHERLANVVEIYEANMNMRLSSNVASGYKPLQTAVRPGTHPKWLNKKVVKGSISKVGCYHCGSRGHLAKFCTQKTNHNSIKKLLKCQVTAMPQATKKLKKPGITPGTIQAEKYFKRPFVQVKIQAGPTCATLEDSGAEVCRISQDLCHKLNIPRGERESIAPAVRVWCAVVPNASEQLIITPKMVELLKMAEQYVVPAVKLEMTENITPIKLGNESTLTFYNTDSFQIPCQERCGRSDRRDGVDAAKRRVSENDDKCNDESIVRSHKVNKAGTHTVHNNNSNNNKSNVGRYEVAHNSSNSNTTDGSSILDKVGNELVNENNNCKIYGSGIVDIVDDHEVDEEKDDEVSGINNCNLDASSVDGDEDHDVDGEEDEKMERNVGNVDQADDAGNVGQSDEADKVDGVGDVVRSGEARVGSDGGRLVDDEEADVHDNDGGQEDATMKNNKCNIRDEDDKESVESGCTLEKKKFLQEQRKLKKLKQYPLVRAHSTGRNKSAY
ncbi:hypothetical protein HELRODRAFT_175906 [Helobdella robusta]|uniref:CCHC-type domain-containing protein n=1 Tax=Helobdella robusta TaxID=6412 RepID=T1F9V2_HELRO|nr:hypothetical protein HELRODRAFT_175906 [Helobdella robusta]ESO00467.1 hypothetical protein HELRODRAFT_175906 [Helobdella robusta]